MERLLRMLMIGIMAVSLSSYAEEEVEDDSDATKSPPAIEELDTDGDGVVSKEEFNLYRGSGEEEEDGGLSAFASFDRDRDGIVTEEELAAHPKYSNPGNGTGELKALKQDAQTNSSRSESKGQNRSSSQGNSGNRGNSGNKGNSGSKGGGSSNKGGKDK